MKKTKKQLALVLLLALALSLAACGKNAAEPDPAEIPAPTAFVAAPVDDTPDEPSASTGKKPVEPEAGISPDAEVATPEDLKAIAEAFVDANVEDLYAAIGYPDSADYAPSCLGPGEDGELHYDGFTVYTYRENGVETVNVVR